MTETITKLGEAQDRADNRIEALGDKIAALTEAIAELKDVQKQADAHMDALILTVDEIIRGRKPNRPGPNPVS